MYALPDYQPVPDTKRFPRQDVRRPEAKEQEFGVAWAHRFLIQGDRSAESAVKAKTVCLKDCIAVAGVPQFFGSDALPPWTPSTRCDSSNEVTRGRGRHSWYINLRTLLQLDGFFYFCARHNRQPPCGRLLRRRKHIWWHGSCCRWQCRHLHRH